MSLRSAFFAGAGIWLRQESLRRILASPGYAPGSIAVNVTWMERGINAGQTHRSMGTRVPIYLQPFASYSVSLLTHVKNLKSWGPETQPLNNAPGFTTVYSAKVVLFVT